MGRLWTHRAAVITITFNIHIIFHLISIRKILSPLLSSSHSSFLSLLLLFPSLTSPLPFSQSSSSFLPLLYSPLIFSTSTPRFCSLVLVLIFLSPVESEALCRHNVAVGDVDCKRQQQDMTEPPGYPERRATKNL